MQKLTLVTYRTQTMHPWKYKTFDETSHLGFETLNLVKGTKQREIWSFRFEFYRAPANSIHSKQRLHKLVANGSRHFNKL